METIVLLSSVHEKNRAFTISHAQKLLNMQKKDKVPGWQLTDKKFILDENGVIKIRHTNSNKESKSKSSTAKSSKT